MTTTMDKDISHVLLTEHEIQARVRELGMEENAGFDIRESAARLTELYTRLDREAEREARA